MFIDRRRIGRIHGFVIDRPIMDSHTSSSTRVTFGAEDVAIPIKCRQGPQRGVRLSITKEEVGKLRQWSCTTPIDMARPGLNRGPWRCVSSGCCCWTYRRSLPRANAFRLTPSPRPRLGALSRLNGLWRDPGRGP